MEIFVPSGALHKSSYQCNISSSGNSFYNYLILTKLNQNRIMLENLIPSGLGCSNVFLFFLKKANVFPIQF